MESQPQNPEFRINPENFHPCFRHGIFLIKLKQNVFLPLTLVLLNLDS